jgi:hypothetical protein
MLLLAAALAAAPPGVPDPNLASWYGARLGEPPPANGSDEARRLWARENYEPPPPWTVTLAETDRDGRLSSISFEEDATLFVIHEAPRGPTSRPDPVLRTPEQMRTDGALARDYVLARLGRPSLALDTSGAAGLDIHLQWDFRVVRTGCANGEPTYDSPAHERTGRVLLATFDADERAITLWLHGRNSPEGAAAAEDTDEAHRARDARECREEAARR